MTTKYIEIVLDSTNAKKRADDLDRSVTSIGKSTDTANSNMKDLGNETKATTFLVSKLSLAISAVVSGAALKGVATMVQEYKGMSERVRMATESVEEFTLVQSRLQETANGTYRALSEAQEIYLRTESSLQELGYSVQQSLDVIDSMSYAFVRNVTEVDRAGIAINSFSRAMAKGKLDTDAWQMILIAIPTIVENVATATGKTEAEIRKLGASGKLALTDLTEGFRLSREENKLLADGMDVNLVDASVRVRNALTNVFVKFEESTGAIDALTKGIINAADGVAIFAGDAEAMEGVLDNVQVALISIAAIMGGRLLSSVIAQTAAYVKSTAAARAKLVAENELAMVSQRRAVSEAEAAKLMLESARAETASAAATVKASIAADAARLASLKIVAAEIEAERLLENQRLKAQISLKGRELAAQRMAALGVQHTNVLNQITKAEIALSAASANTSSVVVAARAKETIATEALAAAKLQERAATNALVLSTNAYTTSATLAGRASVVLQRSLAFLGGPMGVALLAASAIAYFGTSASDSASSVDLLTASVDNLTKSQADLLKFNLEKEFDKQIKIINESSAAIKRNEIALETGMLTYQWQIDGANERLLVQRARLDDARIAAEKLVSQMAKLQNSRSPKAESGTPTLATETIDINVEKEIADAMLKEKKQMEIYENEKRAASSVTESLKRELENRRMANANYREIQAAESMGIYEQEKLMIRAQAEENLAEVNKRAAEDSQRRDDQLRQALANEELEQYQLLEIRNLYRLQEEEAMKVHEEQRTAIREREIQNRKNLDELEKKARMNSFASMGNSLMALGEGQSKKVFEIGKKAALAQAAVSLPSAVMESYKNSGGFPWGIPAAVAMGAVGLKNISDIKNAKYGSTPSSSTQAAAPTPAASPTQGGGAGGNFTIAGYDPSSLYTGEQLKGLGSALQDWWKNGGGDGNVIYQG